MMSETQFSPPNLPSSLLRWLNAVCYEMHVSWQFIRYDLSSAIVPAIIFTTVAGSKYHTHTMVLFDVCRSAVYFWLYLYAFCLSNQMVGIEEDRLNKNRRPLAAGIISHRQALARWVIVMVLFLVVGWVFDVFLWAILWEMIIILHNFGRWATWWFTKQLLMSLGIVVQLAAAWQLVGPITATTWSWIIMVALLIFALVALQDLRDMAGDRQIGRRTFPIIYGDAITRVLLMIGFGLVAPLVLQLVFVAVRGPTPAALVCDSLLVVLSTRIAWRVIQYRAPGDDHRTYILFTYWYCLLVGSALVL